MITGVRKLTEKLLFDYYMISSLRENEVFCPIPYYINSEDYNNLMIKAEIIDSLVMKILKGINDEHSDFKNFMDDFPFKDKILSLKREIPPVFWTRFDGFVKDEGGIFFSEFNYDKPCGQREMLFSSTIEVKNNINANFEKMFKDSFLNILKEYFPSKELINIAFLMDPCHYEEHNYGYLFTDLFKDEKVKFILAGPSNLCAKDDSVWAFDKKIDVILRLFPTEFLYEIETFDRILELFDKGKVLILNDPRVIVCQAKSLFAYLWYLVENKPSLLTSEEKTSVELSLPYTEMFSKDKVDYVIKNKDKLVLKSVFGRYSNEVYIGILSSEEQWSKTVENVLKSSKLHIIQDFCKIRKAIAYKAVSLDSYAPFESYGNLGIYLIEGKHAGCCVRWGLDYITEDSTTWMTPIGSVEKKFQIKSFAHGKSRKALWKKVFETALIHHDFTADYTGRWEYFSIDPLLLDSSVECEIKDASNKVCKILRKTQDIIIKNSEIFFPLMGIDMCLEPLIKQKYTDALCAVGRLDWIIDQSGSLKVLEFNSETPAGILEATVLNSLIKDTLNISLRDPCTGLATSIRESISSILQDYGKVKPIDTIGLLSSTYYEDWYTVSMVQKILEGLPYKSIMGNIFNVDIVDSSAYLNSTKLDAAFRFYPLDWFCDESMKKFLPAFQKELLSINPPHTIITQNKSIFVMIYELLNQSFFNEEEGAIIRKYIPPSYFSPEKLESFDYCAKPFLGREGEGIKFKHQLDTTAPKDGYIYQKKYNVDYIQFNRYSTLGCKKEIGYPVFGAFICNDSYCGIFTRLGNIVTDKWAQYVPTYIK